MSTHGAFLRYVLLWFLGTFFEKSVGLPQAALADVGHTHLAVHRSAVLRTEAAPHHEAHTVSGTRRVLTVEPGATLIDPSANFASALQHERFMQAPTAPVAAAVPVATAPVAAAPASTAPVAAAPLAAAPLAAAPLAAAPLAGAPVAAAPLAAAPAAGAAIPAATAAVPAVSVPAVTASPVAPDAAAAPDAPATDANPTAGGENVSTANATNATAAPEASNDGPPYIHGPVKIFVYGFFFAVLYLSVWYARLPSEKRPAAIDEGLMRWIESQEEDDAVDRISVNCVLVKIKNVTGLSQDKLPASVMVECFSFKKELNIGETDFEEDGVFDTCFVGPLMDQVENRPVTMQAAKPEVKFIVKHQPTGEGARPTEIAQAIMKTGPEAGSSSSAGPGAAGGITRGEWCCMDLKLTSSGAGAMGIMKRIGGAVGGSSLGTLTVEVKAMNVNAAGKALLKSNYYVIAMRNEFKKPYSACARTLAVALMGMLFLTSLPLIGDMFNGCFYLSCHGLSAACTLFCMSMPHWCKLFHVPLPSWTDYISVDSLRTAGAMLLSCGSSGVYMALFWGHGEDCTDHFWILEILLCVDSLLFTVAWWKGEGGGIMGFIMGA